MVRGQMLGVSMRDKITNEEIGRHKPKRVWVGIVMNRIYRESKKRRLASRVIQ